MAPCEPMQIIIAINLNTNPALRKAEIAANVRAQQNRYTGAVSMSWDRSGWYVNVGIFVKFDEILRFAIGS